MFQIRFSLCLIVITSATLFNHVNSYGITWPVMPSGLRSFLSWNRQTDNTEDTVPSQIAQVQNQIQNQAMNTQKTISDNVRKMQDRIGSQINDATKTVNEYVGNSPGAKRAMIISDDGKTVESINSYMSPDGSVKAFSKSSHTASYNVN